MQNLVNRVRGLTGADTAEYTAGGLSYWSDDDLQDNLDRHATFFVDAPLTWQQQTVAGGTLVHYVAQAPYRDLEEAPGTANTSRLVVRDGAGAAVGTADYTVDYRAGRVTFTSDRAGTAYYLTGYTYDVFVAAADVWLERLAHFQDWYDFGADNQRFSRSQAWEHAEKAEKLMRSRAGQNVITAAAGDLRVSQFVRTDLNRSYD